MDPVTAETISYAIALHNATEDQFRDYQRNLIEEFPAGSEEAEVAQMFGVHAEWMAAWAACGLPRVCLGHRHAAALMATNSSPGTVENSIVHPWGAFLISVPDKIMLHTDESGDSRWIDRVSVMFAGPPTDWVFVFGGTSTNPCICMGAAESFDQLGHCEKFAAGQLMARLVFGVALELTSLRAAYAHAESGGVIKRDSRGAPETTTFTLTRDVKVDCREAVRAFCRGGATLPTVQSLVRGHWKRQAHGPQASLRKFIFVEPYWRGPEDAPIAVRSHVVSP